jgi:hypothetical protein
VSALSLGSWRTFEHVPRDIGSTILAAARDEGINFFDDARCNDETGAHPDGWTLASRRSHRRRPALTLDP